MDMIKEIINKICYWIYLRGIKHSDYLDNKSKLNNLKENNSFFSKSCIIENNSGDPNKIIVGSNCSINGYLLVYNHGGKISIGNDCFIGPATRIWSATQIKIGNRVLISHNVNIHDNNSHPLKSKERHNDFKEIYKNGLPLIASYNEKQITICDDVWIGFNSTILKGVFVGRGAIIGSNTVVTKDVPPFAVVVGNPAKIIKYTE
jgi:acetyltransferase-like isoleucine patch superfamily enzyme